MMPAAPGREAGTGPIRLDEVRAKPVRLVAGLMTGTSMDGLDIALCEIDSGPATTYRLRHFQTAPMPEDIRRDLGGLDELRLPAIAELDQRLGWFFADALLAACGRAGTWPDLVGSHGQTVYHRHGVSTLQIGQPGPMALRLGCPVIDDFRHNDIAAGGCGAPLVPFVDRLLLGAADASVLAVNIGGISNLTAVPRTGDTNGALIGFDCGPGNMVMDEIARLMSGGRLDCDRDGALAGRGSVRQDMLERLLAHPFLQAPPPRSGGREQFGPAFAAALVAEAGPKVEADWCDLLATAAEFTALAIQDSYLRHVAPFTPIDGVLISGGGALNPHLMRRLEALLAPLPVGDSGAAGMPADAKEAIAFAILASLRVDLIPANLPEVTGASRSVLLGRITEC